MVRFISDDYEHSTQSFPAFQGSKGSIVRLKIVDFMTYQDVELTAGPNVNLIVGPNGTGKSTVVCAICLVLAGKPKILGRAHALKEYIRHGATTASVEIELFNPESMTTGTQKNFIVKRIIQETGTGASSDWFLNNARVQQSSVEKLMETLNIQLDNLCQFLPQDRVQDFAKMDSIQLLKSTEQSVDNNDEFKLARKHEQLILLFENIKQLELKLKKGEEALRIETQHNTRVENEVRAFNEREELKNNIHNLEGKKLWMLYAKAVSTFNELNAEKKKVEMIKIKEERIVAPMKKEIEVLNVKLDNYRKEMNKTRNSSHSMIAHLRRQYRDQVDNTEAQVHCFKVEFDTSVKNEKDRVKNMRDFEERLRGLKKELEALRQKGDCDDAELTKQVQELDAIQTTYSNKIFEQTGLNDSDEADIRVARSKMKMMESELRAMGEFRSSRMKFLERRNPDVAKAVQYFSDPSNKECFAGNIHEPLILHIYVNDLTYGRVAERHINKNDLTAFFCENKEDVKKMIQVSLHNGWRVSCIHHENVPNFKKPQANWGDLRKYDFQKNLIDLIEAPEYYMSYVCKSARPQEIWIGTNRTDELSEQIINNTSLEYIYTPKYCHVIRTSYYSGQKNSTISYLYDAQIFTDQINAAESDRLKDALMSVKNEMQVLQDKIASRQPKISEYTTERGEVERKKKAINDRIDNRNKIINKIEHCEEMIRTCDGGKQNVKQLEEEWKMKTLEARKMQLAVAERCTKGISEIGAKWVDMLVLKRQTTVLQNRVITKQNQHEEAKANLVQYTTKLKALESDIKVAADNAKRHKAMARDKTGLSDLPDDVSQGTLQEQDVEGEINRLQAQLNFLPDTDDRIVNDYQTRKKKIAEMEKSKQEMENDLSKWKTEMEVEKTSWINPVQDLIHKINLNFGRFFANMKCVGEISLSHADDENDFAKYGVKIMVKFRSNEPLVELTGWKQSGGERAITTALYILALQELTKVPFRVIDEINQGMDARNESRFFQLLCSLAQGHDTPQYFLLTPKMLPPVEYPDNVDFHIIFNGPYVKVGWKDAVDSNQVLRQCDASEDEEEEDSDDSDSDD